MLWRPSLSSTIYKHLLLLNRLANQSQNVCGASLGRGNKSFINGPGHMTMMAITRIYGKKNLLLGNRRADFHENWGLLSIIARRDVKSSQIIHPDVRIRFPDTSGCSHHICQTIFASYMSEHIVASMLNCTNNEG